MPRLPKHRLITWSVRPQNCMQRGESTVNKSLVSLILLLYNVPFPGLVKGDISLVSKSIIFSLTVYMDFYLLILFIYGCMLSSVQTTWCTMFYNALDSGSMCFISVHQSPLISCVLFCTAIISWNILTSNLCVCQT